MPRVRPLSSLDTPSLLLDERRLDRNLQRMAAHLAALGVPLRPHVKTAKCAEILRRSLVGQPGGVTVSTLAEAEQCLAMGVRDILYAVGIAPQKLDRVAALNARGADITVVLDSVAAAQAVAAHATRIHACIELDSDGHRAGVGPESPLLLSIARTLGPLLRGVVTHAGESYACVTRGAKVEMAERERAAAVRAAARLRAAGHGCPIVSVGSTPTALFARDLTGVTEVRAGVHMLMDLVMAGIGVCEVDDIAISVLATVIGHQEEKGWVITDAGWMALSRDRGTATQAMDQGYGLVCDERGQVIDGVVVRAANQEHGILAARPGAAPLAAAQFPLGRRLRILPNHACATAAQFGVYHVVTSEGVVAEWPRFGGW